MLNKYNDFILEKLLTESVIYFSKPFRRLLNKVSDPISKELLNIENTDVKPDITFVDLDREGYISFATMRNAKKILTDKFPNIDFNQLDDPSKGSELARDIWDMHDYINTNSINLPYSSPFRGLGLLDDNDPYIKSRSPLRLGRFINNVLPGKFTAKEIEDFVNNLKSKVDQTGEKFIEVSGEEIGTYYDHKNYKTMAGTLGSSCMARHESGIFELYIENPDVCKMLVLLEDGMVIGRALIWKLTTSDNGAEYFLDRQYTIKESDVVKFRTYAKQKGWSYKSYNNHVNLSAVTYNDVEENTDMTVKVRKLAYKEFPYVDTFRRYDPSTGTLYNDQDNSEESIGNFILSSTSGGYEEVRDAVYSDWYDCEIERSEAVWSAPLHDWIYDHDNVEVTVGSARRRGYYPESYDDIVYLEHESTYCHIDDAVWSEYNNEYFLEGTTVDTIVRIDEDTAEPEEYNYTVYEPFHKNAKDIIKVEYLMKKEWFEKLSDKYSDWSNTDAVHKDLLTLDYKEEYVLDIFVIETFLIKTDNEKDHFYLTKEDAKLFDYELETAEVDDIPNERTTDWFDYYKEIKSYENNVSLFRDTPLITLDELFKKIENEDESVLYDINNDLDYWYKRKQFISEFMEE